jgi:hypothetical protein
MKNKSNKPVWDDRFHVESQYNYTSLHPYYKVSIIKDLRYFYRNTLISLLERLQSLNTGTRLISPNYKASWEGSRHYHQAKGLKMILTPTILLYQRRFRIQGTAS